MGTRVKGSVAGLALAAVVIGVLVTVVSGPGPAEGQTTAYRAPRLPGTQNPNLNGIWQAFTTANWDLLDHPAGPGPLPERLGAYGVEPGGRGIVDGNQIPYKPEALAQ